MTPKSTVQVASSPRPSYIDTRCRQQIIESGATSWPRSCPTCKFGPCINLRRLPKTTDLQVDIFAHELKKKLLKAMDKKGKSGWENPDWKDECQKELIKHVAKGDPLDVAAYAMFCHYHGWSTWPDVVEETKTSSS